MSGRIFSGMNLSKSRFQSYLKLKDIQKEFFYSKQLVLSKAELFSICTVLCLHTCPTNQGMRSTLHSTNQHPSLLNQSATACFNVTFNFSTTTFVISSYSRVILD